MPPKKFLGYLASACFLSTALGTGFLAPETRAASLANMGDLSPNGSFETGDFTDWETIGNASIETSNFGITPPDGEFQALIASSFFSPGVQSTSVSKTVLESFLGLLDRPLQPEDFLISDFRDRFPDHDISGPIDNVPGGDGATSTSGIKQTFVAQAGDILSFEWNFLTNEDFIQSLFIDSAFVAINDRLELLADSNDFLFDAETNPEPFVDSSTIFRSETGFRQSSFVLPEDGEYTLGFGVFDGRSPGVASALVVDDVRLERQSEPESVPEPAGILSLIGLGLLGVGQRLAKRYSSDQS